MWICVWAGSGAQEEIQPAAFRLAQEYSSLSSSRLGKSQHRDAFADLLCYFAGFRQWGEEEDSQTSGLANGTLLRDKGTKMVLCRGTA